VADCEEDDLCFGDHVDEAVLGSPRYGENSSLVGPREEGRTRADRQAHPGGDEVVHNYLDGGAIKHAGPEAPDQRAHTEAERHPRVWYLPRFGYAVKLGR
jgi:hypothetical protein